MRKLTVALVASIVGIVTAQAAALPSLRAPMAVYVVSSPVGYRVNPMGGGEEAFHKGVDLVGPKGCVILAAGDGVVVEHWPAPGTPTRTGGTFTGHPTFGGMIVIDHGGGLWTLYGHMSATYVSTGQRVKAGQAIGKQGHTGDATGDHLHLEVIVNPLLLFAGEMIGLNDRGRKELMR